MHRPSPLLKPPFTMPVHYVRHIADQVRTMGGDVVAWLHASGLTEAQLAGTLELDGACFERLVLDAMAMTQEPALGLFVGERLVSNSHGILGYAVMSARSIRQAFELFERFLALRTSMVEIAHEVTASGHRLRVVETNLPPRLRRPVLEAVMMSVRNVLRALHPAGPALREVSFAFPAPPYASLARELLGCEVKYGRSWTGVVVPQEGLDAPLLSSDPEAFAEAAAICERELDKRRGDSSLAGRVRRSLFEKRQGFPSLQVTARLFHLTPRTLHRRLVEEGTSYRALLEEVRHALAVEHLKGGRAGVEEIAWALGYTDVANFRRAFKRWEGLPPSAFAARLRSQQPPKG